MVMDAARELSMEISHTIKIYHEAHREITDFLNQSPKLKPDFTKWDSLPWRLISSLNGIFYQMGFLITINTFWQSFLAYYYDSVAKNIAMGTTFRGFTEPEKMDDVYGMLADDESKAVFDWLLKYRLGYAMVGPIAVDIFPYLPFHRNANLSIIKHKKKRNWYEVKGYIIDCWNDWNDVDNTWINEQYLLAGKCEPERGEVIIDAGGFQGGTAIWFADKAGESGKVYSFEPLASNYQKMKENIDRNKLGNLVIMNNQGLWDCDTSLLITNNSSASTCSVESGDAEIKVTSLDSCVQSERLERVDFIKMDIEGAELNALRGASQTIKKFKPKLAISIYHLPTDIHEIPFFIKSLVPEYRLYLSHKFNGWHETVLFATVD